MLKLFVGDEKRMAQNATIPVRWCVDKATWGKLKEEGVINPHILLVTVADNSEITRQLAPLDQLIEYVQFQRSGRNKIFATIVWSSEMDGLWRKYLKKENGEYRTHTITRTGEFVKDLIDSYEYAEVDVVVPVELFAKEPPKWEKAWVNLFFSTPAKDQCEYRRRRIVAYTAQPFVVLFILLTKLVVSFVVAVFLLLCGMRGVRFKPLVHPFSQDLDDIWYHAKGCYYDEKFGRWKDKWECIFIIKRNGKKRSPFFWPFIPICPCLIFTIFYFMNLIRRYFPDFISMAITTFIIVVGMGVVFLLGQLLKMIVSKLFHRFRQKPEAREKKIWQKYEGDQLLICNGEFSTNIKTLPIKKRTIHLRFMDLKARVCKPLPR